MTFSFSDIVSWAKSNELLLGLIASAVVGTMPEKLPTVRELPQWLWSWFHEASKTFLNFRKGIQEPPKPVVQAPHQQQPPQQLNG
jgi:hypothetical protein